MPPPKPDTCADCKFCVRVGKNGDFECHLRPPVLSYCHDPNHAASWLYPHVLRSARACSEIVLESV